MRALVTGATGFIGRKLVAALTADGGSVGPPNVTSRSAASAQRQLGARAFAWDPMQGPPPAEALCSADGPPVDVVFHLAGEPVAEGRWTDDKKRRIRESRTLGTRHLVEALASLPAAARPRVLVAASAVGIYGRRGDEILEEDSRPGEGFLVDVCRDWEAASMQAEALGVRVVVVRIGIVLGEGGGALGRMETFFKLGLGGRLGDGRQWMPWIHVDDVVGLLLHAAHNDAVRGPMNAVAPQPATNAEFTRAYGSALSRPAVLPVPRAALRLAFGELSSVLLASQRVVPRVAERTGYRFRHPRLLEALRETVGAHEPLHPGAP